MLLAGQARLRIAREQAYASTTDRDVHGRTLRNDRARKRILLNDKAILVGGTKQPSHLADPQADRGQFTTSGCLPAVPGS